MNYKEYLGSKHWIEFRKRILRDRKICQNCGKRDFLNLHHKNYRCLGRETGDDIIVLCGNCHNRFHKKEKWIKKYRSGEDLDFTGKVITKNTIFNIDSPISRICERCSKEHPIFYMRMINEKLVLCIRCDNSRPRTRYLPFEEGLNLPIFDTRARIKAKNKAALSVTPKVSSH
jgi:hypothetical protein